LLFRKGDGPLAGPVAEALRHGERRVVEESERYAAEVGEGGDMAVARHASVVSAGQAGSPWPHVSRQVTGINPERLELICARFRPPAHRSSGRPSHGPTSPPGNDVSMRRKNGGVASEPVLPCGVRMVPCHSERPAGQDGRRRRRHASRRPYATLTPSDRAARARAASRVASSAFSRNARSR
jgi:hypothetical protein